MHDAFAMLLLLTAFYGFAFGAVRLLLRRSAWAQFSLEAPWLAGPALLVLIVSAIGYRLPAELPAWQAWGLLAVGWAASAAVAMWDRIELAQLIRQSGRRAVLLTPCSRVLPPALCCGSSRENPQDNIHVPWINEYINYGELASVLTGHHHGHAGTAVNLFSSFHREVRCGQDIIVAAVANIAGVHPMQAVLPLAILFRFQNTIALGLLVFAVSGGENRSRPLVLVLVLDAVLLMETLLFGSSFFSSNCTMPLYAIYLVWLACQQQFGGRELLVIVLMNLFFLVTYPEFLVVTKIFEGLAVLVALWRHNRATWLPLAAANALCLVLHPLAIPAKLYLLNSHILGSNGWDARRVIPYWIQLISSLT